MTNKSEKIFNLLENIFKSKNPVIELNFLLEIMPLYHLTDDCMIFWLKNPKTIFTQLFPTKFKIEDTLGQCIKFVNFEKPENLVLLLECLTKTYTNFTINTDSEGKITTSWFHFETQFEEEFLNISDNLTDAIIKTAIESLRFPYLKDDLIKQAQKIKWAY